MKDKVAIVTGGARGIGKAIVLKLASQGCHVAFNYAHSQEEAQKLKKEVKGFKVKCMAERVDVQDFTAVKSWVEQVKSDFGRLDILVNNAGITRDRSLMMMTKEEWDQVINTNLNGMFHFAKSCIVTFMKQKSGNIINISSVSGIIGLVGQANYSASKGGMNAFTKALAKEVGPFGVRVNAVCPGFIETEILSGFKEDKLEEIRNLIPLNRIGKVEDVAHCVAFLLSEEARYITGQLLTVDGGLAMR